MCSNREIVDSLECCVDDLVECFEDFVKKSLILIFLGIGIIVGLLCYLLKLVSERPPLSGPIVENAIQKQNEINAAIEKNKMIEQEMMPNKLREDEKKKKDNKTDKIDKTGKTNNIDEIDKTDKIDKTGKTNKIDEIGKTGKVDTNILELDTDRDKDKSTTAVNTSNLPILPSFDEKVLREVELSSCSKYGCSGAPNTHIYIPSRVPIPSVPTSSSKHKLIPCIRKRSLNKSNLPSLQICPKVTKPGSCCSMCCNDEHKKNEATDRPILYTKHQ